MKKQPMLLVAEDDADDQYFFLEAAALACPADVQTHLTWDGASLLKIMRERSQQTRGPKLIVLDLNMPLRDGRTTLQELKADPCLADIPVAILTTSDNPDDAEYCLSHGAVAYYRKPGSIMELVTIVRMLYKSYLQ